MSDWIKILATGSSEKVPDGWKTTSEIAKEVGEATDSIYRRLSRRRDTGVVESQVIKLNGKLTAIWRPIEKPKHKKSPAKGL